MKNKNIFYLIVLCGLLLVDYHLFNGNLGEEKIFEKSRKNEKLRGESLSEQLSFRSSPQRGGAWYVF